MIVGFYKAYDGYQVQVTYDENSHEFVVEVMESPIKKLTTRVSAQYKPTFSMDMVDRESCADAIDSLVGKLRAM